MCLFVSCHLRDGIVLCCFGERLQEVLNAPAAAMLMEYVKYQCTVSHPSTSGQISVFVSVIMILKTSWHDPVTLAHVFV